ncbi:phosphatase PAP2 family protein [Candidatus Micrarchaeota archaeon]|nr:phosphatase PAP2 family protein [Candidatus Micrarchaeota archaeon]
MALMREFLRSFAENDAFLAFNALMNEPFFLPFMILLAFAAFLSAKNNSSRVTLLLSLLVTTVLATFLKSLYADPRPCAGLPGCEDGFGFPSGHSALAFAIATPTFGTRFFYFFVVLATVIALSRVVAGVHFIPQIVGGAVLGFIVSATVKILVEKTALVFKR